jgi:flagellar assembly factor FliW
MTPPQVMTLARTLPASAPAPVRTQAVRPVRASARVQVQALSLAEPLPGFPDHREYVLVPAEDGGRLFWLQSLAPDGPRFLAVPASAYFPDYVPTLPDAVCDELDVADVADARLYCIVTVPDGDVAGATANLRAPVVVNPASRQARQVVLTDPAHPIRQPLRR